MLLADTRRELPRRRDADESRRAATLRELPYRRDYASSACYAMPDEMMLAAMPHYASPPGFCRYLVVTAGEVYSLFIALKHYFISSDGDEQGTSVDSILFHISARGALSIFAQRLRADSLSPIFGLLVTAISGALDAERSANY